MYCVTWNTRNHTYVPIYYELYDWLKSIWNVLCWHCRLIICKIHRFSNISLIGNITELAQVPPSTVPLNLWHYIWEWNHEFFNPSSLICKNLYQSIQTMLNIIKRKYYYFCMFVMNKLKNYWTDFKKLFHH